jgi:AraC-like DNA-binding protein
MTAHKFNENPDTRPNRRNSEPTRQDAAPPSITRFAISTSDADELAPTLARLYPGASFRPLQGTHFHCDFGVTTVGPVSFASGDWVSGAQADAAAVYGQYVLLLAGEDSKLDVSLGDERLSVVHQKRAILLAPERPANLQMAAGTKGRSVTIARSALEAHFVTMMGYAPRGPLMFEADMDLTIGGGAMIAGIVRLLREEIENPAISPLIRPRLCDVLLTALVTIPRHMDSHLLESSPPRVAPGVVRRAEEYMAAHSREPIALADIVAAAGAPARSIHAAFRRARGITPMEFLKSQRLEQARFMLMSALPDTTVAGAASIMGFRSPGRFSVEYSQQFGESPSETLWRSRPTRRRRGGTP